MNCPIARSRDRDIARIIPSSESAFELSPMSAGKRK